MVKILMFLIGFLLSFAWAHGSDLGKAPPSFTKRARTYVFVDFKSYNLNYEIDFDKETVTGRALIHFESGPVGYPLFDLIPNPSKVVLDGQTVRGELLEVSPPDRATTFRAVDELVVAGQHTLELTFSVTRNVKFSDAGIDFSWKMADAGVDRGFLERYAPANLQFDQFSMTLGIDLKGARSKHQLFVNGQMKKENANRWFVRFPNYFSSNSFYFHLTSATGVLEKSHPGREKNIPLLIYSEDSSLLPEALQTAHEVIDELEKDYGPYPHAQLIIQVDEEHPGMEYSGAVHSNLRSLEHEIFHSWFGRGVMPQDGNASWIDEALARWRDRGYPRKKNVNGRSENIANLSLYSRLTPWGAYGTGSDFIAHVDYVTQGIKPLLAKFFKRHRWQSISSVQFVRFLETESGISLEREFQVLNGD